MTAPDGITLDAAALDRWVAAVERMEVWPATAFAVAAQARAALALRDELAECRAKLAAWEEREAACCPEDFGFPEVIESLRAKLALAECRAWRAWHVCGINADPLEWPALSFGIRNAIAATDAAGLLKEDE